MRVWNWQIETRMYMCKGVGWMGGGSSRDKENASRLAPDNLYTSHEHITLT